MTILSMLFLIGDVAVDTDARQLRRAGAEVHLSPKAFELLEILIAARPRAVRKQELYDRLWPDTFVVEANLPVLIGEIRAALGDESRTIIRTVQRFGYAFTAELPAGDALVHVLVHGDERYRLAPGENVAGRDPAAEVFIASASVSRRHAIITVAGEDATLTDLGSKNGTWIDGQRVAAPTLLADGNVIRFGGMEMTYRRCDPSVQTATLSPG
jgi:DNA-binding winged helix-turn-helix (wHTH) protein